MLEALAAVVGEPAPPDVARLADQPERLQALQEAVWRYREQSWTYGHAALAASADLELDPPLTQLGAEWLCRALLPAVQQRFTQDAVRLRVELAVQYEHAAARAFQQFERSCLPLEIETVVTGRAAVSEGEVVDLPNLVTRQVRSQSGNPALLMAGLTALTHLRDLFGLAAPKHVVVEQDQEGTRRLVQEKLEKLAGEVERRLGLPHSLAPGDVLAEAVTEGD